MNFKLIAVLLILLDLAWKIFLEYLDRRSMNRAVPACVKDVYDEAEYQKWRAYKREKDSLFVKSRAASFAAEMLLLLPDVYAAFAGLFPQGVYWQIFSIVLLTTVVSEIVDLPFTVYNTFVIEEKYGFNKSTVKTFVLDEIKEIIIVLLLTEAMYSLFAAIHLWLGSSVILIFAAAMSLLVLVISLLMPLFSRIFNKFTPLEDGELKDKLTGLLTAHGYKVRAVEVMDASRRSTRMNAYFTGIGPAKTIVLYDTLVEAATPEQLCAVFAHELGHGLNHDMIKNRWISFIQFLLMAAILWVMVSFPRIYTDFGFDGVNYGFAFILMNWVLSIASPLMGRITAGHSCRAEYRADLQSVKEGYGEHLISALKMLARSNFSNLAPDPLLVRLTYDHPSLEQRINAIEKAMKQ